MRKSVALATTFALALSIGAVATVASIRAGRAEARAKASAPVVAAVTASDPNARAGTTGASGGDEATNEDPNGATDENGAPMVMDLPDTPGHTGGQPRSRNGKPGKPQRPKFLNTRE